MDQTFALPIELTIEKIDQIISSKAEIRCFNFSQNKIQINKVDQGVIEKLIKKHLLDVKNSQYHSLKFVHHCLLIKINSLCKDHCFIEKKFIEELIKIFNKRQVCAYEKKFKLIQHSKNDRQFFSQIIDQFSLSNYLTIQTLNNVLQGECVFASFAIQMCQQAAKILDKSTFTFYLSFLALRGNKNAFIPQVHISKNHEGQKSFAQRIYHMVHNQEKQNTYLRQNNSKSNVQDPYSIRCGPQIYGVVFQTLNLAQKSLKHLMNKNHFQYWFVDGKKILNLNSHSQTYLSKLDYLLCSLNEIGSVSSLKVERVLNKFLGKNTLFDEHHQQSSHIKAQQLKICLQAIMDCVAENRLLSISSNIDTMNAHDYQHDIYYNNFSLRTRFTKMIQNLQTILYYQGVASVLAIQNIYESNQQLFKTRQNLKHFKIFKSFLQDSNQSKGVQHFHHWSYKFQFE